MGHQPPVTICTCGLIRSVGAMDPPADAEAALGLTLALTKASAFLHKEMGDETRFHHNGIRRHGDSASAGSRDARYRAGDGKNRCALRDARFECIFLALA
jgi:hypothetical protein